MEPAPSPGLRIGELAQRVGVSTHVLRAWERRYGLLHPERTVGGYRVYSLADERRVRAVAELRLQGVPAGEAVARVLGTDRTQAGSGSPDEAAPSGDGPDHDAAIARLLVATESFDEDAGQAVLDQLLDSAPLGDVVGKVVLPFLEALGERWAQGRMSVAQEHFASNLVRRRLSAMSLTWGVGRGPVAVLACPPGERHDIALLAFGLLLGRRGWRIRYLGPDTPLLDLARAARIVEADAVVLAATRRSALSAHTAGLRHLARTHRLLIAGRGADETVASELGAELLPPDPVAAAELLDPVERSEQAGA